MRHLRNLAFFVFGLILSALLLSPYAIAAGPSDVVGPFSPYPPYQNPWVNNTWSQTWPATTTGTATGADITRQGSTTVTTATGTKIKIPVSVTSKVTKANIARAVARAAKVTPAGIAAGVIAEALVDEGIKRCQANQLDWCKEEPLEPDVPANVQWRNTTQNITSTNPQTACGSVSNTTFKKYVMTSATTADCYWQINGCSTQACEVKSQTISATPICPEGYYQKTMINGQWYCASNNPAKREVPASEPDIEDAAKKDQDSNPGNSPKFTEAARKDGHSPDKPEFGTTPTTVSAPPVTTAPRETGKRTITNPDGSTSTETKTTSETVTPKTEGTTTGDTRITNYTVNTTTITNITNNTTNQQTIIEDTETSDGAPNDPTKDQEKDVSFTDASMPDVPKLYTQKYPDGIAGAWRDNKPDIASTQFWAGIRSMFPEMGSGGSCPNFQLSFGIGNLANFGTMPFDVPCWIYQAIGLIMLTTAAFCARKIIF